MHLAGTFTCTLTVIAMALTATPASAQHSGSLRVNVLVVDADLNVKPVPKHVLLIRTVHGSKEQRLATGFDGVLNVTLAPGDYVVESEKPLEFRGSPTDGATPSR